MKIVSMSNRYGNYKQEPPDLDEENIGPFVYMNNVQTSPEQNQFHAAEKTPGPQGKKSYKKYNFENSYGI